MAARAAGIVAVARVVVALEEAAVAEVGIGMRWALGGALTRAESAHTEGARRGSKSHPSLDTRSSLSSVPGSHSERGRLPCDEASRVVGAAAATGE